MNTHGGQREGAGRPEGALNKITRPVKELAAEHGPDSIKKLIHLRDHADSEQVQFAATKELLDRAYGRPHQEIAIEDKTITTVIDRTGLPDPPVTIEHQPDSTDEPLTKGSL